MAGDQDMIAFLQRAIGYSLSGSVEEEVLFFMHGTGRNGKSTFVETLALLFGPYYAKAPASMLMSKGKNHVAPTNDLARLRGTRFVVASELQDGLRFDEALIKDLTGADTITARFLHKEFFQFSPHFQLWIYGNTKPQVRGDDEAIWRRILLIPFTVTIPKERIDPHLKGARGKLAAELPGILAWAVRGATEWYRSELRPPKTVCNATAQYRAEMDVIGEFIADCCTVTLGARARFSDMYERYSRWCGDNGHYALSSMRFNSRMRLRGFGGRRTGKSRHHTWLGLGVRRWDRTSGVTEADVE